VTNDLKAISRQNPLPSGFSKNKLPVAHFLSQVFLWRSFARKHLACGTFFYIQFLSVGQLISDTFFYIQFLSVGQLISASSLVYRFINIKNNSNYVRCAFEILSAGRDNPSGAR